MKNAIKIIILCFFLYSCNNRKVEFDKTLIKNMSKEDFNLPSKYVMLQLYGKCENNQVVSINIQQLRVLYNRSDKSRTFEDFLDLILNQKQNVPNELSFECFVLDKEIRQNYEKMNLQDFISKYFDTSGKSYRLNKELTTIKRESLFYYCFINNYVATFDDYIGYYYLKKTENFY